MAYTEQEMQQIVAAYGPAVYRLAMAQLRNQADAEDAYQDVFLKLIRANPEFKSEAHQKAWLLRVTINCCKDQLKKAFRRDLPLEDHLPAEAPQPSALNEALEKLSPQHRALIHLYYYEGYKCDEIAVMLEMRGSTVRSGLLRARAKLKDFITEGEDDLV
jgi:RNA polymerase sigma-70 factor (ECF subfamily)